MIAANADAGNAVTAGIINQLSPEQRHIAQQNLQNYNYDNVHVGAHRLNGEIKEGRPHS